MRLSIGSTLLLLASAAMLAGCHKPEAASVALPGHAQSIVLGMGCFWGAEKRMAELPGVLDVESGYAGGDAETVGYRDVLALEKRLRGGRASARNHAEVIKVSFDPGRTTLEDVLIGFWQNHDPTQGDRQGNDIGSNYRSAIYYDNDAQKQVALATRAVYQQALERAGRGAITTEIAPLRHYNRAETEHQDYLRKNPNGYCGLGGTGVAYDAGRDGTDAASAVAAHPRLDADALSFDRQLIVFEAEDCPFCALFKREILDHWRGQAAISATLSPQPPEGWSLEKPLFATPTTVLFKDGREVSRYTGYNGDQGRFWTWLGYQLLTPEQQRIAFEQGTEHAFTGSHLDETRPGTFVDPVSGAPLFRSDSKFESGTGWPSFFNPVEGSITLHQDRSHGMVRTEVRSASSGIHLGHVFDDGPPPTGKRYCINGNVLVFVPDETDALDVTL